MTRAVDTPLDLSSSMLSSYSGLLASNCEVLTVFFRQQSVLRGCKMLLLSTKSFLLVRGSLFGRLTRWTTHEHFEIIGSPVLFGVSFGRKIDSSFYEGDRSSSLKC